MGGGPHPQPLVGGHGTGGACQLQQLPSSRSAAAAGPGPLGWALHQWSAAGTHGPAGWQQAKQSACSSSSIVMCVCVCHLTMTAIPFAFIQVKAESMQETIANQAACRVMHLRCKRPWPTWT